MRTKILFSAAMLGVSLLAGSSFAAAPSTSTDDPKVKIETPPVDPTLADPTRDSAILSRAAAKRRGEDPDGGDAGADTGDTPRTSTRCWDGACARSDWTSGIRTNRGPNMTVRR